MSNEKNLPYAVVCGSVNIDIGAHSFAPLRDRDSNPGRVELSLGGVGRNIAHNMAWLLQCIEAGRAAGIEAPKAERGAQTNYIR